MYAKFFQKTIVLFFSVITVCFFCNCCTAIQKNFVVDRSGVLDSLQREKLNNLYLHHEKITTNQIALLTTDNYGADSTIEEYSLHLFNEISIGQKDKNNGVLIVLCMPKRKVRIATGYGTEKVLTDSIAKMIIESIMIPEFKEGKYFDGLWKGSLAITTFLEKPENKIK